MDLSDLMVLIKGLIDFPSALLALVKLLRVTPQENHEAILKKISDESIAFEQTGRPTWEK